VFGRPRGRGSAEASIKTEGKEEDVWCRGGCSKGEKTRVNRKSERKMAVWTMSRGLETRGGGDRKSGLRANSRRGGRGRARQEGKLEVEAGEEGPSQPGRSKVTKLRSNTWARKPKGPMVQSRKHLIQSNEKGMKRKRWFVRRAGRPAMNNHHSSFPRRNPLCC